jgi:hypothetical protein
MSIVGAALRGFGKALGKKTLRGFGKALGVKAELKKAGKGH